MKDWIKAHYGLEIDHLETISPNVWRLKASGETYYLKRAAPAKLREALGLVQTMSLPFFAPLIPCRNGELFVCDHQDGFFLCLGIETEENLVGDFKLRHYLSLLAKLHQSTFYVARIEEGFYVRLIESYRQRCWQCASWYENCLHTGQLSYYPDPAYWSWQDLYPRLCQNLARAERLISQLESMTKQKETRRLCLTYRHYAPEHFACKTNQLIGLDHCRVDSPVADLVALYQRGRFPFVEWEMLETFYFAHFDWQDCEKLDFAIQLCLVGCLEIQKDPFKQVEHIFQLQMYLNQLEVILSCLKLENS